MFSRIINNLESILVDNKIYDCIILSSLVVLVFCFGVVYGSIHKENELIQSRRAQDNWMQVNGDCVDCAQVCTDWTEELPECIYK